MLHSACLVERTGDFDVIRLIEVGSHEDPSGKTRKESYRIIVTRPSREIVQDRISTHTEAKLALKRIVEESHGRRAVAGAIISSDHGCAPQKIRAQ